MMLILIRGLRLGCSTIICVGLDLDFINKQSHASGTGDDAITEVGNQREVENIDGTIIYTSKTLDSFRHWIERRIRKETGITFINTSKGANIQGMKNKEIRGIIHSLP